MLVNREWSNEPEMFEAVTDALGEVESNGAFVVNALDERDEYGFDGYISIRTEDGRRFRLLLAEVL